MNHSLTDALANGRMELTELGVWISENPDLAKTPLKELSEFDGLAASVAQFTEEGLSYHYRRANEIRKQLGMPPMEKQ